ncbi:MAG: 2-ketoisovalerate ferredoxin oxidoreductase subunit alpha [Candidatus Syntrophoarchaeum butanivorans]|uniref:2-ketoisovalerate ferredoxin oxidoreductase subunit alpha n=2 Tax=Candidatus Syntropharchaeum butanivorans TaxID=1839936 RepID=A0A1F2P3L4_9EURY|nr:MAG: 2-ketoisovalerate ferredoxin oxidoreductase subunit alpha [Candidatus Syntrophoarchaeum butanivorans]
MMAECVEEEETSVYVTGCEAAARAVIIAKPSVVAAYPITPQTEIVEKLSLFIGEGRHDCQFIAVESEHSALSACIGAASCGARTFTATSSHGLLYMAEMLYWAAIARLPIVMANANRALASGWNIWADHIDSLSQRDAGWIQFYTSTVQEVYDTILIAFRVAENEGVMLPVMVNLDGFLLTHINQPLRLVDETLYQEEFLDEINVPHALNLDSPHTLGTLISPSDNYRVQHDRKLGMERAKDVIKEAERDFLRLFGREYHPVMEYRSDDAEVLLLGMGTLAKEAEDAVDMMRFRGIKAGLLRLRQIRPFPDDEIIDAISRSPAEKLVIIDRDYSPGSGGILSQEVKTRLYDAGIVKEIVNVIAGVGGQDVSAEDMMEMVELERGEHWWGI